MKSRFILLFTLAMSMAAYSMNLSWLGKLKPVVSRAASVACNYVKEHKVIAVGVGAVASAGAIAVALYAYKMYWQASPKKLWDAVVARNEHEVRVLLEAGVDPNIADVNYGETLLHAAVRSGNVAIVRLLCDYGANKEQIWHGSTPLHMAVERGYTDIVRTLVQAGANKEAVNRHGNTPLLKAVAASNIGIVRILVQAGANKEAVDSKGCTPLRLAAWKGNADIVRTLVQAGANKEAVDRDDYTALHGAVVFGNANIVNILVQAGANKDAANRLGSTPLHVAVIMSNPEIFSILVQAGANTEAVNYEGYTPLYKAVACGNSEIVRILVQAGANTGAVSGCGRTLRDLAEVERHQEIIDYLDSLPQMEQQMHAAAQAGNVGKVQELIAQRAPVLPGIVAALGEYNLQAPSKEHGEIARLLLDVMGMRQAARAKCADGRTLLHVAAACGNTKFAEALARYGADVNAVDVIGNTPLHLAKTAEMNACLLWHGGAGLEGSGFAVENKAREIPFFAQINQWMPWFRKWVEEDQKIPALFTGTVQS